MSKLKSIVSGLTYITTGRVYFKAQEPAITRPTLFYKNWKILRTYPQRR